MENGSFIFLHIRATALKYSYSKKKKGLLEDLEHIFKVNKGISSPPSH
jgi:hypothetical protein